MIAAKGVESEEEGGKRAQRGATRYEAQVKGARRATEERRRVVEGKDVEIV